VGFLTVAEDDVSSLNHAIAIYLYRKVLQL